MALTLKQALAMFWEQIQVRFVKRENGKGLSTNDFTNEEKNKLASLKNITIDTTLTISNAAADAKAVGDKIANHTQAASTITAGTFAGAVVAQTTSQTPGTSLLRNSKIVSTDTNPSNNGEICWTYE